MSDHPETDILLALERRLMRPAKGEAESLLADDFIEIGASGRLYDRAATLAALANTPSRTVDPVVSGFVVRALAPDLFLTTWRIESPSSLRSSLWRRTSSGWRILFHQGTPAP